MKKQRNLNNLVATHRLGSQRNSSGQWVRELCEVSLVNYKNRVKHPGPIEVHFDAIEDVIVEHIYSSEIAVGAIAWLSNLKILRALSQLKRAAIIVQKEDTLRVDTNDKKGGKWKFERQLLYDALRPFTSNDFPESYPGIWEGHPDYNSTVQHRLFDASGMYQFDGDAVRCLGYCGTTGELLPRMHHKFLVLGSFSYSQIISPKLVITGSFNMTHNATTSRENIVVIHDRTICHTFVSEWAQLWSVAESLNWISQDPEKVQTDMGT